MRAVFVSHSSVDREFTEKVCDALGPVLERDADPPADGYGSLINWKLVVDFENLQPGRDPWPDQLHEWLARSNAGLILLTPDAVRSDWVLKEATILAWRHSRDPRAFPLFVTKHPGVDAAFLKAERFTPLMLEQKQWITSTDPATIAKTIRDQLGMDQPPPTLFDDLVGHLTDLFTDVKEFSRLRIANAICYDMPAFGPGSQVRECCEQIARRLLRGRFGRLDGVGALVEELAVSTGVETLDLIFRTLAPFWVDAAVAGGLYSVATRSPPGVAAVNGLQIPGYTGRMYATRAHNNAFAFTYIPINNANAGDCVEDVTREIVEFVEREANRKVTPAQANEWLAESGDPAYVAMSFTPVPADLVALRGIFRTATFVVSTGEDLDRSQEIPEARWLEPQLDTSLELAQQRSWTKGMRVLKRKRSVSN